MFTQETRRSETRNRTATITPISYDLARPGHRWAIMLVEDGRLIKRSYCRRAGTLRDARNIAKAWCA